MTYNIETVIKSEENKIYAYIDKKKPFEYLYKVNLNYFNNCFDINKVYDFVLDHSNWLKKQGVYHNNKFYSIRATVEMMFKEYNKNDNRPIN